MQEATLNTVVNISRQFLRSIQIDDDFGREDALSGYVCQGTARTLLESMSQQILQTKQRAFTLDGALRRRKVVTGTHALLFGRTKPGVAR